MAGAVMRPADWFLVDLAVDPTPGDAFGIRSLASKYADIADIARDACVGVRHARSSGAASAWVGDAGDVFRDRSERMPGELAKANDSYAMVADALRAWAESVDDTQAQADRGLQHAREAAADLASAEAALGAAQLSWTTVRAQQLSYQKLTQIYATLPPPSGVTMPTDYQLTSNSRSVQTAQAHIASAQHSVADAQSRLSAAAQLVHEAKARRDGAEKAAVRAIGAATGHAVKPASMWDAITSSAAWQAIVEVATVVLTIVSIVAIFVGGPLVWALIIAATVLLLADALMKAAQGQDVTMTIVLLLVGLIPGGRALTSVAKIADVFRSGSTVARGLGLVGVHLLSVSKIAIASTARSVQRSAVGLIPGVTSVLRGIPGAFGAAGSMRAPVTFLKDLSSTIRSDFQLGSAKGWTDHLVALGDRNPAAAAKIWQTGGGYHGTDLWVNSSLPASDRAGNAEIHTFEAGAGGAVSNFVLDGGTAASRHGNLNSIWDGAQVGRSGAEPTVGRIDSLRNGMYTLQTTGSADIPIAHSLAQANPQFGSGMLHQTYFPNMTSNLREGHVVVISNATGLPLPVTFKDDRAFVTLAPGDAIRLHGDPVATTFPTVAEESSSHVAQVGLPGSAMRLGIHLGAGVGHGAEVFDSTKRAR